jgi:hypothetical protein
VTGTGRLLAHADTRSCGYGMDVLAGTLTRAGPWLFERPSVDRPRKMCSVDRGITKWVKAPDKIDVVIQAVDQSQRVVDTRWRCGDQGVGLPDLNEVKL